MLALAHGKSHLGEILRVFFFPPALLAIHTLRRSSQLPFLLFLLLLLLLLLPLAGQR
jgi:hypothetical protein